MFAPFWGCLLLILCAGQWSYGKENCKDSNVKCAKWAWLGECTYKPGYMLTMCKKSCNLCNEGVENCRDLHFNCSQWAWLGECTKKPGFMSINCKRSCDQCNDSGASIVREGQPLDTWECEQVTRVPAHIRSGYRLSTFYQKYLHAYGIPIISSNRTQDNALRRACYVVVFLLADRLDIRTWFYRRRGRAGVIAHSENATSIPEHSWGPNKWNQQTRGMGATREHPISTGGEENLLCYKSGDRYSTEDIFLHEIVHAVHILGVGSNGAIPSFNGRLRGRFTYLKQTGERWNNTYAMSTDREYLAEGAQSYFDCNDEHDPPNGIHNHINTRTELASYDPQLYRLLQEIFPCQNKYFKRCDWRAGKKPYHFKMNCDKNGIGTLMDFQTKRPVASKPPTTPPPPTPETTQPPVNCEDLHAKCAYWGKIGECTKNPAYMLINCKKSCNVNQCNGSGGGGDGSVNCEDLHAKCAYWAKIGECTKNPGYMITHCKKSCDQCNGSGSGGDGNGDCADGNLDCVW